MIAVKSDWVTKLELAIETKDLTKRYGTLTAVNKLNLKVKADTVHGFLGPNGAGKTTTLKMLVGLLKPNSGSIRILGQELGWDKADIRLKIGYMPELPKFPKHLKGRELLDIYGKMYGMTKQERREQIPRLLERAGLKERENDLIGEYSKGMQQRLGMAQALLNEPELIILDEPTIGLDPVGMVEVRELVKGIVKEGVTVFLSSHLLNEVQQVCSDVTIINKGEPIASGTLEEISALVAGPAMIEIEVDKLSDKIIKRVKNLPFVTEVSKKDKLLLIRLDTRDDVRSQVSQAITSGGGTVISMNLKAYTLEDAFMQLITGRLGKEAAK